ncbi:cation diffusion facilitator family transporter [Paenibacillus sp. FSL M8-0334]|uniref:cation diffusion facilitator family transporter n=1 Tax=Paenibacillus sp. FSL M8-0334 TaxID=2921623 RepID=UPI0030FBB094
MSQEHINTTEKVVWTGIFSDLALAIVKGAVGFLMGSKALIADAMHSAATAMSLLADRWTNLERPSRKGRWRNRKSAERTEFIIPILIAVFLIMGGLQLVVLAVQEISTGNPAAPDRWVLIAGVISLAVNEAFFLFQYHQFKKHNDRTWVTLSEDHRYGLYSSLTVIIGVSLSMAGGYFEWSGLLYMDSIAAIIVALLVVRKGYILIVRSVYGTLVKEARHEFEDEFMDTIQRVHGVITVEDLKVQEFGQIKQISIDVKISVNPRITVFEANEIAERIRKLLMHRFTRVTETKVIVVPYDPGYPYKTNFDLMNNDLPTLPQ